MQIQYEPGLRLVAELAADAHLGVLVVGAKAAVVIRHNAGPAYLGREGALIAVYGLGIGRHVGRADHAPSAEGGQLLGVGVQVFVYIALVLARAGVLRTVVEIREEPLPYPHEQEELVADIHLVGVFEQQRAQLVVALEMYGAIQRVGQDRLIGLAAERVAQGHHIQGEVIVPVLQYLKRRADARGLHGVGACGYHHRAALSGLPYHYERQAHIRSAGYLVGYMPLGKPGHELIYAGYAEGVHHLPP